MRQTVSSGSVKAIWINKEKLIERLKSACSDARKEFPEIKEIWLIGSLAKGEETGLSDIDLFIIANTKIKNPIERIKPYFNYFTDKLKMSIDIIVATPEEKSLFNRFLKEGLLIKTVS